MTKLVALDNNAHKAIRIQPDKAEATGADLHLVPVVTSEFQQLVVQYPIVFTKNSETGQFMCSAMLGLEEGENLFWEQNAWQGIYVPLQVARQPFFIGQGSQIDKAQDYVVCLDVESNCLSETEGEPLFDEQGQATAFLEHQQAKLAQLLDGEQATQAFIETLLGLKLLTSLRLDITLEDDSNLTINGLYTIDEEALQNLDAERIAQLHQQAYLPLIYTMLASQGQIYSLIDKKNKRLEAAKQWFQ